MLLIPFILVYRTASTFLFKIFTALCCILPASVYLASAVRRSDFGSARCGSACTTGRQGTSPIMFRMAVFAPLLHARCYIHGALSRNVTAARMNDSETSHKSNNANQRRGVTLYEDSAFSLYFIKYSLHFDEFFVYRPYETCVIISQRS
jgi:hypothetical protein